MCVCREKGGPGGGGVGKNLFYTYVINEWDLAES